MGKSAELNTELVAGLKAAKSKRAYFAFVLKGGSDGALIVSKTKVPPAAIAEAKKQCGGSAVLKGFCTFDEGTYVFETAKQAPGTAAQAIKLVVKRDAGLTIKPEFRISGDAELDGDESENEEASLPVAPPIPPSKSAANETGDPAQAIARWIAVRNAAVLKLQNEIKLVVASKDPEAGRAELELKAVMKQLAGKLETKRQAAEMSKYLKEDDVVADVNDAGFDLKGPLVAVLDEITPQLPG
jgi:hypothetical protein